MKKAEAISILATSVRPREAKDRARYDEAVKMAIEALKSSERTSEASQTDHIADSDKKVERDDESAQNVKDGDLIFRQAAIDALHMHLMYRMGTDSNKKRLDDWINGVPSVQPERKWIPCSERLPKTHKAGNSVSGIFMESKPVLVYGVPEYESEYSFNVVTYCDDLNGNTYWSTEMDAVTINEVTAWMPLPEPYKERREE